MGAASTGDGDASAPQAVHDLMGRVVRGRVGTGSKSAREAILLKTPEQRYVLRRKGGNAFNDPELDRLVGKTVRVSGFVVAGATVIADRIDIKD